MLLINTILLCGLILTPVFCNKYSKEKNVPEYKKLIELEKPFRMLKLNLIWEKATKKIPPEKLKSLYTDLKYQDKEELNWKAEKAKGLDKNGLKEAMVEGSFKAILDKYHLSEDFSALKESVLKTDEIKPLQDDYMKAVFKDKKTKQIVAES
jgi:hypothetical protein